MIAVSIERNDGEVRVSVARSILLFLWCRDSRMGLNIKERVWRGVVWGRGDGRLCSLLFLRGRDGFLRLNLSQWVF
jgi:hypothetical protein